MDRLAVLFGDFIVRQVWMEIQRGNILEQTKLVKIAECRERCDFLRAFDDRRAKSVGVVYRHVEREIAAISEWLKREDTCLLLAPHHDVGFTDDLKQRQMEYLHHGDALVPRQQRFGQYTRSLMKALDVPVHNTYGLRPAIVKGTKEIAPLTA